MGRMRLARCNWRGGRTTVKPAVQVPSVWHHHTATTIQDEPCDD